MPASFVAWHLRQRIRRMPSRTIQRRNSSNCSIVQDDSANQFGVPRVSGVKSRPTATNIRRKTWTANLPPLVSQNGDSVLVSVDSGSVTIAQRLFPRPGSEGEKFNLSDRVREDPELMAKRNTIWPSQSAAQKRGPPRPG